MTATGFPPYRESLHRRDRQSRWPVRRRDRECEESLTAAVRSIRDPQTPTLSAPEGFGGPVLQYLGAVQDGHFASLCEAGKFIAHFIKRRAPVFVIEIIARHRHSPGCEGGSAGASLRHRRLTDRAEPMMSAMSHGGR